MDNLNKVMQKFGIRTNMKNTKAMFISKVSKTTMKSV